MRFRNHIHCVMLALALSASAVLSSCGRDDDMTAVQGGVQVGFRISVPDISGTAVSRGGEYDDGTSTDYENYIDFLHNDYCVMFFDEENRYLTTFRPTDLIPIEENDLRSRYYTVMGEIERPLPSSFKVVIMANWHNYPTGLEAGVTTIDDMCSGSASRYAYTAPFVLSAENAIPMYGVKQCEGVSFKPDMLTYLGTVYMLRAMAKIEVSFPDNGKEWTLDRVALHRYNSEGFCAPEGVVDEADYVKGYYEGDYVDGIHVIEGAVVDDTIDFMPLADGRHIIYVPEHRNTVTLADGRRDKSADASEIVITFKERGSETLYKIDFKDYANNSNGNKITDYFDLQRNYYYKYTIAKHDDGMAFTVDVVPYVGIDLDPGFGWPDLIIPDDDPNLK